MFKLSTAASICLCAWALAAGPALAQSANLYDWASAGDALIESTNSARLTTAAVDSAETPLSATSALIYFDLEPALALPAGTLAADTLEGSGLQLSFNALAGTTVAFNWQLTTVGYDAGFADRAFAVIDGATVLDFATVAALPVNGVFSHTFNMAGPHSLAFGVVDVNDVLGVSTLAISNFSVSVVPEPTTAVLLLAGLAGLGLRARNAGR